MAQSIYIPNSDRSAHNRIERAIPKFMARLGMAKDQATAVAIRLESLGRLKTSGAPINKPKATRGLPIPVQPWAVLQAITAMKKDNTPKATVIRENTGGDSYDNAFEASRATRRPTRSNRLRTRVTRGR
jgi:hypothetical protein